MIAASSPQPELHRHFHHHVDRGALQRPRRELPLLHGSEGALVETVAQSLKHLDVTDRAVAPHDDLHHDIAAHAPAPRLFGVVGLHLAQQRRRRDAAARTIRSAAGAAALALADARALSLPDTRASACANTTVVARPVAVGRAGRRLHHAGTVL